MGTEYFTSIPFMRNMIGSIRGTNRSTGKVTGMLAGEGKHFSIAINSYDVDDVPESDDQISRLFIQEALIPIDINTLNFGSFAKDENGSPIETMQISGCSLTAEKIVSMCDSRVDDFVRLSSSQLDDIVKISTPYWLNHKIPDNIPDMIMSGTIPLFSTDIVFAISEKISCKFRVHIDPDIHKRLEDGELNINMPICVGYMRLFYVQNAGIAKFLCSEEVPLYIVPGKFCLYTLKIRINQGKPDFDNKTEYSEMMSYDYSLHIWHCVQSAMLIDEVKNSMDESVSVVKTVNKHKSKSNHKPRQKTRYVKNYVFGEKLHKLADESDILRTRVYREKLWSVAGHWRHYKNGKVVFVHPYWKGELRNTKENPTGRTREIVADTPTENLNEQATC